MPAEPQRHYYLVPKDFCSYITECFTITNISRMPLNSQIEDPVNLSMPADNSTAAAINLDSDGSMSHHMIAQTQGLMKCGFCNHAFSKPGQRKNVFLLYSNCILN